MTSLYREMNAEQLEIAYAPSSAIGGDYGPFVARYIEQSALARTSLDCLQDLQYGSSSTQVLDFFHGANPGIKKRPLHLFIHGGYWQELSHKESATMADALVKNGISFAVMNYTLAPIGSIDEMVEECRQCLAYLVSNSDRLGVDINKISVSGHSAGAQLLLKMLSEYSDDISVNAVGLAIAISGIYDLRPICHTSINAPLALSQSKATELSPQFQNLVFSGSVLIAVAENDTDEFRRQALEYHQKLQHAGIHSNWVDCGGLNHFDIILEMENGAFPILQSIVEFSNT